MAVYNFNNKKVPKKNIQKNLPLAEVIEKAGNTPEYREEFYKRFLKDDIYVLVDNKKGFNSFEETPIVVLPNNIIPVFTHPDRIYDHNAITEDMNYIKVKGRAFLEMVVGEPIIVNPFSKVYKELIPLEISEMLNGSIFNSLQNKTVANAKMDVLIGHPKETPTLLLEALVPDLKANATINAAYLGWVYNPVTDSKPHYIFAIESNGANFESIAKQVSETTQKHLQGDDFVDIIQLEKGGNFSDFFYKEAKPFYKK